jgi:hypothetical protein
MKLHVLRFLLPACVAGMLLCLSQPLHAQPDPIKFGKVELADLQMKSYAPDTSAEAVILGDYGKSYFKYGPDGFQIVHDRHVRIKILKKSGYDWATVKIPFYRASGSSEEKISSLNGYSHNVEGGKPVKEKLTKEAIFEEKKSTNWYTKNFTMPNVKEGTVLEYEYTIISDFLFNLREWEFQNTIPVAWSEYRVVIPEYFRYRLLSSGYEPFHVSETGQKSVDFTIRVEGHNIANGGFSTTVRVPTRFESVQARATSYRWVTKDVPALRDEPFITTMQDYITKIEFELSSTQFPGDLEKPVTSNWEAVNDMLLQEENFGGQLNRTSFAKDIVAVAKAKANEPAAQIALIYDFVRKSVKWNGHQSLFAENSLKKAYENHTGNVGDVNLMLVGLLRDAGLNANPVILSTRDHGRLLESYTMISKFNYVIAHVNLDGKDLLLDATDPLLIPSVLPTRCLNGAGRLISKKEGRWVSLYTSERLSQVTSVRLKLDPEGQFKGTVDLSEGGYAALPSRKVILGEGQEKYAENLRKAKTNWQIEKLDIKNAEKLGEALGVTCQIAIAEGAQMAGNRIYLKPLLTEGERENPFKNDVRKFPVDFGTPIDRTFVGSYTVPEGYVVEEMPKNIIVDLPEKGGRFTFMAAQNGNVIQVTSKISFRKSLYLPEEYAHLKEFYHQIVSKHAEQIVLKKQ